MKLMADGSFFSSLLRKVLNLKASWTVVTKNTLKMYVKKYLPPLIYILPTHKRSLN